MRNLNELIPVKADDLKIETITQLEQNFIDGKTAYYFIGPWLIKTLKEQNTNFGVSTLPTMDGKQMKTMAGVHNAYVSSYSEYPNAAQLFAEYLVSEEGLSLIHIFQAFLVKVNTGYEWMKNRHSVAFLQPEC